MVFHTIDDIIKKARTLDKPRKVAVAQAAHDHVIDAVLRAKKEGFVDPILVGSKAEIAPLVEQFGGDVADENYVDVASKDPNEIAAKTIQIVKEGRADFIMKGKLNTAEILRAVLNKEHGLKHGKLITQFSLAQIPGLKKLVVLNDAAITPYPTLEQKAEQIRLVSGTLRDIGYDEQIHVAALCAAETLNPKIIESVEAAKLKEMCQEGAFPGVYVEGPISLDITLDAEVAKLKGFESPVAGNADVLLFPNMVAGNLTSKLLTIVGGGVSVGMVIGAGVPISLTSRAATAEAKYTSLALAASAVREVK